MVDFDNVSSKKDLEKEIKKDAEVLDEKIKEMASLLEIFGMAGLEQTEGNYFFRVQHVSSKNNMKANLKEMQLLIQSLKNVTSALEYHSLSQDYNGIASDFERLLERMKL